MSRILVILFIAFLPHGFVAAGGVAVGNGGNIARCATKSNYQSLDYMLTKGMYGKRVSISPIKSLNQSFQRILNLILQKFPKRQESFREFVGLVRNRDESKQYVWHIATDGLDSILELDVHLPFLCRSNFGSTDILQAVVREKPDSSGQIIFDYDQNIFLTLEKDDPLQLSFLLVHEWLWNFFADIEQVRKVNYFLHSSLFDELSPSESFLELNRLGL